MKNIIFVFLCLFSLFSHAGEVGSERIYKSLTEANLYWYESNIAEINDLLLSSKSIEVIPIINTIGEIWQFRDGAIGSEIAPVIAQSFIYHPHVTFLWFNKHSKAFDDWITELPEALLTDYDGSYADRLKAVKKDLLVTLNSYLASSNSDKLESLANKFISKLEATEVKIID